MKGKETKNCLEEKNLHFSFSKKRDINVIKHNNTFITKNTKSNVYFTVTPHSSNTAVLDGKAEHSSVLQTFVKSSAHATGATLQTFKGISQ